MTRVMFSLHPAAFRYTAKMGPLVRRTCGPFATLASRPDLRRLGDLQEDQSDSDDAALNRLWEASRPVGAKPSRPRHAHQQRTGPQQLQPSSAAWVDWGIGSRAQLHLSRTTVRLATRMRLFTLRRDHHCHALRHATSALQWHLTKPVGFGAWEWHAARMPSPSHLPISVEVVMKPQAQPASPARL